MTSTKKRKTPASAFFDQMMRESDNETIMLPHVKNYFHQADFPDEFAVHFRNAGAPRRPDGFFHPSTHPTKNLTHLYYYLEASQKGNEDLWIPEQLSYESRMAVMFGTALHDFLETAFTGLGFLMPPSGICKACGKQQPFPCTEHGVMDKANLTRGHMDGVIPAQHSPHGLTGLDWKSSNNRALESVKSNDLEAFKKKWPYYYGQAQSYMLSSDLNLRHFVFVFIALGYPWTMREFLVPFDEEYVDKMKEKYQLAQAYLSEGITPPGKCCPTRSRSLQCSSVRCRAEW